MKNFLAFIVLLSHMNTSMFLPQIPEQDLFDKNGNQVDDINSVIEYIQVALGNDTTPDDEDDDNGQNLHLVNTTDFYYYTQPSSVLQEEKTAGTGASHFSEYKSRKINVVSIDIITPPPQA